MSFLLSSLLRLENIRPAVHEEGLTRRYCCPLLRPYLRMFKPQHLLWVEEDKG